MMSNFSKKIYFTTSWDDGSRDDFKVVEILNKFKIKGTFYIPKYFPYQGGKYSEYKQMTSCEIRELARAQEIGSHTLNHKRLDCLKIEEAEKEIKESKLFLENITGKPIEMFCYPQGYFSEEIIEHARNAGYLGARTTNKLTIRLPRNPYLIGTSVHIAPFPFRKLDPSRYYLRRLLDPLKNYGFRIFSIPKFLFSFYSWKTFSRAVFDFSFKNGNYFHLYGHSWELEKYQMWKDLENFLKYVIQFPNIEFTSNSEVVKLIRKD